MPKHHNYSVVRARIKPEIKEQALIVLNDLGVTQTEAIERLFMYIATYREVPFDKEEILVLKES